MKGEGCKHETGNNEITLDGDNKIEKTEKREGPTSRDLDKFRRTVEHLVRLKIHHCRIGSTSP